MALYSLYGYHGRGNAESEEDVVGGSQKETAQESGSDWLLFVGES